MGGLVMTDELEKLSDAKLSEVLAVEVAGWKFEASGKRDIRGWLTHPEVNGYITLWRKGVAGSAYLLPPFATSADAVLPHLEKVRPCCCFPPSLDGKWEVEIENGYGRDATFARAACIALIRAARAQKGAV